jgi:hypothetical protein
MSNVAELAAEIQQLSAADKHLLLQQLLTDSDEPDPGAAGLAGIISFAAARGGRQ